MKKTFFLLIAFFVINNAIGQWATLNTGTSKSLNDIYFVNSNIGYAVGDSGVIIKTTNGGVNWIIQNSNVLAKLSSVFFTDTVTGYIVGDSAVLLKTINGGLNWVKQSLGLPINLFLNSVYFTNDSTGYVASSSFETISNSSIILRSSNKFTTWDVDTLGVSVTSSIFFTSKDTGYFVGNSIRKTTNGGMDWQSESFNSISLNTVTSNLYDHTIVAVGDSGNIVYGYSTSKILDFTNLGTTENLNYIKYDSYYHKYFVVGNNGSIFINNDQNPLTNWTSINSGVTCNLNCVSTIDQSNYSNIIVGDSGTILKTSNLGSSWFIINSGVDENLNSYAGNHGPDEWGFIVGDSGVILKLYNNTVTRIQHGLTNRKLNYICYNGTSMYGFGYYIVGDKGTIIKTNNFQNFTIQNVDTIIDLYYIHFYRTSSDPTNSGFACGFDNERNESVILYTSDGGTNWHKYYTGITTKIKGGADQDEYIAGEGGTILYAPQGNYTSYNFKYWSHINSLPNAQSLGSVFFTDNNTGYSINRNLTTINLFKTNDGGKNWNLISNGVYSSDKMNSLFFTNSNVGYIAGSYGKIAKTTNAGDNWIYQNSSTSKDLYKLYFPNENVGYAVGKNGTMLKTWVITVNNPIICAGDTAILTAGGNGVNYIWSNGDTGSSISVAPTSSTTFTVTGFSSDGFSDTVVALVTVIQQPNVTVIIDNPIINLGQSAIICASGCDSYTWNTGQITPCITVSPPETTVFSVIGENECGFTDSASAVITIVNTTSTEGMIEKFNLLLYPVPANDKIIIESSQMLNGNLFIYDVRGLELLRQQINDSKTQINLSSLSSGIYFLKLITKNSIVVRKIIKE